VQRWRGVHHGALIGRGRWRYRVLKRRTDTEYTRNLWERGLAREEGVSVEIDIG